MTTSYCGWRKAGMLVLFLLLPIVPLAHAADADNSCDDPRLASRQWREQSILRSARPMLKLYRMNPKLLSGWQRERVLAHGVPGTPLHSQIWGLLAEESFAGIRSPLIREFFLRTSELPDYRLHRWLVEFSFLPVSDEAVRRRPQAKTPVVDFGFSGRFQAAVAGRDPATVSKYVLRFSASPFVASGLFYQTGERYLELAAIPAHRISAGAIQRIELSLTDTGIRCLLNGEPVLDYPAKDVAAGLVSIIGDQHPVLIHKMELHGSTLEAGGECVQTGLLPADRLGALLIASSRTVAGDTGR